MPNHIRSLFDLDKQSFFQVLKYGSEFKKDRNLSSQLLAGKSIGLIFEKPSTRTRVSLEVGINQLGGNAIILNHSDIQLSRGEDLYDTAKVLSRYLDAIVIRSKLHDTITGLAEHSEVPVLNALSDRFHPMQILADFMTIIENGVDPDSMVLTFLGDGNNNICKSLMAAMQFVNGTLRIATPEKYNPDAEFLAMVKEKGAKIELTNDPMAAVSGADILYTDVWTSMGNEDETEQRKKDLAPYQINVELLLKSKSGVQTENRPYILHCLPAMKGEEITAEMVTSDHSRIFDQAENRLHIQKGLWKYLFNGN